jgi:hypothetical protein
MVVGTFNDPALGTSGVGVITSLGLLIDFRKVEERLREDILKEVVIVSLETSTDDMPVSG